MEIVPERNEELNNDYSNFLKNKDYKTKIGGEVALIAYEIGKMSGVKKIYGIDEQATAPYNYNIGNELENRVDSLTSKITPIAFIKNFLKLESYQHWIN